MEYTKLSCRIKPDSEINREILIAELGSTGFESFTETSEMVEAFIPSSLFSEEMFKDEVQISHSLFKFEYTLEIMPDQNWNEVWEKTYFKPLLINDECLIRAPFHMDYPKAKYEIIIEPKMAFGTGNHETTELMVMEILNSDFVGKRVLDMGCGTGILGILASMKGADSVTCIDIDENAYRSAYENAGYNNILNLEAKLGGVELTKGFSFDIILANIQRNILLNDLPNYLEAMIRGGELIMSGFYIDDLLSIQSRAKELGLSFGGYSEKNNWIAAKFILK